MKPKASVKKALRLVESATDSEPVRGEDLLRSPRLKRALKEAKARMAAEKKRKK